MSFEQFTTLAQLPLSAILLYAVIRLYVDSREDRAIAAKERQDMLNRIQEVYDEVLGIKTGKQ